MIAQRPPGSAPAILGVAEALPFADDSFDAAMAVLTVHHWSDQPKGLTELRRVARGPVVVQTFDPAFRNFWLYDYLPALVTLDEGQMPPMARYAEALGEVSIIPVPIPHDCIDGFLAANWRRPEAYLDPQVRAAISSFHKIGDVSAELARIADDLGSGAWARKYGALLELDELDCGYRLVVTR
jgi:SAM-dependent methyltransferase